MSDLIKRTGVIDFLEQHRQSILIGNAGYTDANEIADTIEVLKTILSSPLTIKSVQQWIPCSERLPDKEYELYWTTHEDGSIVLHGYTKKNGFIYNWEVDDLELRKRQGGVVAWMLIPMPEPYKGE